MNPDRWSRIKEVFESTVDELPARQAALVHAACVSDPDLEAEVLRLLQASHDSSGFLEKSAAELMGSLPARESDEPAFTVGAILLRRFEIRRFINRGGMGEVYEAWDAQLNQAVALKTILPYIAANPAIIARFKQEVRHAREVSHPNICRVHELFCDDTVAAAPIWFLSMELLRGTTLLERIRSGGELHPRLAANIADQMLAGLGAAHTRNLVHRDFKTGNVMLLHGSDAQVRVVITDFGLAVINLPDDHGAGDLVSRGTPGYMPPEQRRGEHVGATADQYAFGVVLWEMMTGLAPPVLGPPDAGIRRKHYPGAWPRVIQRCTANEPKDRFRDMAAVRSMLLPGPARKRVAWATAALLLFAAGSVLFLQRHLHAVAPGCVICDTTQITPDVDKSESPSLSRDGHMVAYSSDRAEPGNLDIFVQTLPSGPVTRITHDSARDTAPTLSPDGKQVAFRSERAGGGVYLASTQATDKPRLLVSGGRDPRFSPDGKSLLYWIGDPDSSMPSGKVFRLFLDGSPPQPVATQFKDARYPIWNADGGHMLLTGCSEAKDLLPDCFDWWVGDATGLHLAPTHAFAELRKSNFDPGRLNSVEWQGNKVLFTATSNSGRLNLAAATLHPSSPFALERPHWLSTTDAGELSPSLSMNDRISFTRTTGALHVWRMSGLLGRKKPVLERVTADPELDGTPFVAGAGRYLVFGRGRGVRRTIVLRDTGTGLESTLINRGTAVQSPIVDDSGTRFAYQQTEPDGSSAIYAGRVGGAVRRVCVNCFEPFAWFDPGRTFFYHDGANAIAIAPVDSGEARRTWSDPNAILSDASWAPATGDMIVVRTTRARRELVVTHLNRSTAVMDSSMRPLPEERGVPIRPRWFADGNGVVYVSNRDGFMCLYTRRFDPKRQTFEQPVAFAHFHNQGASIDEVLPRVLNLSVSGDTLFLNLGERSSTIQIARIQREP